MNSKNKETIFKVGDKVFDAQYGWGVVSRLYSEKEYNVVVSFRDASVIVYTNDGKCVTSNKLPRLSFTEYDYVNGGFSQERPIVLPEKGDLIWVRFNRLSKWYARYYSHALNNGDTVSCFDRQKTDGITSTWDIWQIECPLPLKINI